ncbi:MAG: YdeI/OmpD-associated family protein [Devosia sp.]
MEANVDISRMKREIHKMPHDVEQTLNERGLIQAYNARPAYQQNDYVGWITRAKRTETRRKRLNQMLDELETGGVYMRMKWNGDMGRSGDHRTKMARG